MPARNWRLQLSLEPRSDLPRYLQIARAVVAAIRSGELQPGQPLPGSRTLAHTLGMHRNTVLAAFDELSAEGWVTASRGAATCVSRQLPTHSSLFRPKRRSGAVYSESEVEESPARGAADHCGFPIDPPLPFDPPPHVPGGSLMLSKGAPDVRLLPVAELARAYRRALRREGSKLLTYGDPRGLPQLRAAFARMLRAARGIQVEAGDVLVTRGSQMALDLAARALIHPGDTVAIEALGHPAVWTAFRLAGARLQPLPVDRGGLDVNALATLLAAEPVRAVYVTPQHQFPTTVVMPPERRLRLLELARHHGTAIIEDDYDHEFYYHGPVATPLASLDRSGTVLYIGTLSKILAPGLRVGFATGPRPVLERMTSLRVATDLQGDQLAEWMVAECFESGELGRHARRMRRAYGPRRDALASALRSRLGDALSFELPVGGMALWALVRPDIDLDRWIERARQRGVVMRNGNFYDATGSAPPAMRLGFSYHDPAELALAADRMAEALRDIAPEGSASTQSRSTVRV